MIKINLLPHKKVKAVEKGVLRLRAVAVALAVLVFLGLAYWFFLLYSTGSELAARELETSQRLEVLKKKVKDVENFEKTRRDLEQKLKVIQELQKKRIPMSAVLSALNLQTTKEVWFTALQIKGITFELSGMVLNRRTNADAFFKKLEGSGDFTDLILVDVKEDPSSGGKKFAFKVTGKIKGSEQAAPQDTQSKGTAAAPAAPAVKAGK